MVVLQHHDKDTYHVLKRQGWQHSQVDVALARLPTSAPTLPQFSVVKSCGEHAAACHVGS